jgi:hypothetical protein
MPPSIARRKRRSPSGEGRQDREVVHDVPTAFPTWPAEVEALCWRAIRGGRGGPARSEIRPTCAWDRRRRHGKSVRETLSEPAVARRSRRLYCSPTPKEFSTFFARQVSIWGQVVRENNIKASGLRTRGSRQRLSLARFKKKAPPRWGLYQPKRRTASVVV